MANVHRLNEINNGVPLVLYLAINLEAHHLIDIRLVELNLKTITHTDISPTSAKSEITTKLEEIQVLQSEINELETKYSMAQKDLTEMYSLKQELARVKLNVEPKDIDFDLKEEGLSKKKELTQMMGDLATANGIDG